jgi:hypothetical protein
MSKISKDKIIQKINKNILKLDEYVNKIKEYNDTIKNKKIDQKSYIEYKNFIYNYEKILLKTSIYYNIIENELL